MSVLLDLHTEFTRCLDRQTPEGWSPERWSVKETGSTITFHVTARNPRGASMLSSHQEPIGAAVVKLDATASRAAAAIWKHLAEWHNDWQPCNDSPSLTLKART